MERHRALKPPPEIDPNARRKKIRTAALIGAAILAFTSVAILAVHNRAKHLETEPNHNNVATTVFWIGEPSGADNAYIPNDSSTWVQNWKDEFGGVDAPDNRCNNLPCGFTPKENPFYFALPYNDLDTSCNTKPSIKDAPWYDGTPTKGESIIKNRWLKVTYGDKTAYAQWEDAGPLGEDDTAYVFGNAAPHYEKSGLDLSPATAEYLGLDGTGKTSWEFVEASQVPDGPWRQTITTSVPDCAR